MICSFCQLIINFLSNKIFVFLLLFSFLTSYSQDKVIIYDDFSTSDEYIDLSERMIWGTNTDTTSAFKISNISDNNGLTFDAISLTDSGYKYLSYTDSIGLKTAACIDYEFPYTLYRQNDTIVVEFDAIWDELDNGGARRRVVCAILHEYPEGGPGFNMTDSIHLDAPYGRPAYNWRVLSRIDLGADHNYANIFYGGGHDTLGEFEIYNGKWWLPGFISGPGGLTPENKLPNYPETSVMKYLDHQLANTSEWGHFKVIIYRDQVKWYYRRTKQDTSMDEFLTFLETPEEIADTMAMINELNAAHGSAATKLPVYYNYFDGFKAIRLYMNGDRVYIANVKVSTTQETTNLKSIIHNNNTLSVYSNPANNFFTVSNNETIDNVKIYSITGDKIMHINVQKKNIKLNCKDLTKGIYIIEANGQYQKLLVR